MNISHGRRKTRRDLRSVDLQQFTRFNYHQEFLLLISLNDNLCLQYVPQQRPLGVRMPQLYQLELMYRAPDEMDHQRLAEKPYQNPRTPHLSLNQT